MNERIELTEHERRMPLRAMLACLEHTRTLPQGGGETAAWLGGLRCLLRRAIAESEEVSRLLCVLAGLEDRYRAAVAERDALSAAVQEWEIGTTSPFQQILAELSELHDKKKADYGTAEDPLANIRQSERFGIPAWLGAVLRGGDKIMRIQSFAKKGRLENEPLEDSLRDLAVYAVIALQLYREQQSGAKDGRDGICKRRSGMTATRNDGEVKKA